MNRKLSSAIVCLATAISVAFCAGGCNSGNAGSENGGGEGVNVESTKSEKVDAAGWKSAIDATYSAVLEEKNVTIEMWTRTYIGEGKYILKLDGANKRLELTEEETMYDDGRNQTNKIYIENDVKYELIDVGSGSWYSYPRNFDGFDTIKGESAHFYDFTFTAINIVWYYSIAEYDEANGIYKFDLPDRLGYNTDDVWNYIDAADRDKYDKEYYFKSYYIGAGSYEVTIAGGKLRDVKIKLLENGVADGYDFTITLKDYGKTKVEPVPQSVKDAVKN